jgi:excisionase family DNA binding protein
MTQPLRLSISEAAKFFGVEPITIRRAIKRGELRYVVVRGRYRITFESLLLWSQQRPKIKNKLAQQGIGQYVEKWKIKNKLFSPNPAVLQKQEIKEPTSE